MSENLRYQLNCLTLGKYKPLIDTRVGISIFKENTVKNIQPRFPVRVIIQRINVQKFSYRSEP